MPQELMTIESNILTSIRHGARFHNASDGDKFLKQKHDSGSLSKAHSSV